jgi:hypothetical protein
VSDKITLNIILIFFSVDLHYRHRNGTTQMMFIKKKKSQIRTQKNKMIDFNSNGLSRQFVFIMKQQNPKYFSINGFKKISKKISAMENKVLFLKSVLSALTAPCYSCPSCLFMSAILIGFSQYICQYEALFIPSLFYSSFLRHIYSLIGT